MLKLPKGLKKKKKGKKSKRKGEQELFTEEELEKYRREHQQPNFESGEGPAKENEEWSKFKDLTTGVDSILKKTQGDLDRIKSTSFFQRVPAGPKEPEPAPKQEPTRPVVEITEADFPQLAAATVEVEEDRSDYGVTDDESEEDDQDDIFDTSYVEAVERGEVKLAYVPDSPEEFQDDDIFDTSHVDAIIRGQEAKTSKGKKGLDIGIAVEVLTGRIDNVTIATKRPSKRVIPGDLLLEDSTGTPLLSSTTVAAPEPIEKSILDLDSDIPITSPIDLSVSLHTSLIQQNTETKPYSIVQTNLGNEEDEEIDEFTLLATESLEVSSDTAKKLDKKEIEVEPVLQESWSAFEADKNESVFADGIIEDENDVLDPYLGEDDPFDTSFADAVVPSFQIKEVKKEAVILEDDDDFDPRAEEVQAILNNRRKSSVRIHLTDPSGIRESITSDDIIVNNKEEQISRDLLGGSTTDLTQLGDSPLDPIDINTDFDPFDTSSVDKVVAPGKVELKFLEQELIGPSPAAVPIFRVPSDPDFDPRAEEPKKSERRPSRPENLTVSKSVVFNVEGDTSLEVDTKGKINKPLTPYYSRELSITEDLNEEAEAADTVSDTLTRTRSDEDLAPKTSYQAKRRHSEYPQPSKVKATDLLHSGHSEIKAKVLTPSGPEAPVSQPDIDPFDTSFASNIAPGRTELKLLAKEFSCEEADNLVEPRERDLLEPADDLFQVKALSPEPPERNKVTEATSRITIMAFNPFLSINEPAPSVTTEVLNPFMSGPSDADTDAFGANDNPFATSNPFSDFGGGGYEPPAGDTVPVDIFGGVEQTGAKHFNVFDSDVNMDTFGSQPIKPTELELITTTADEFTSLDDCNPQAPASHLPPETQNLILSVTGQMEFTSSHLLDRIPPTRTPSPVSVRDIHSSCPTPEPEMPEDSMLDNAEAPRAPSVSTVAVKPARPPPARPPPVTRPPPPRPAPPPVARNTPVPQQPQRPPPPQVVDNEINLFDAPAPVVVKPTKEAILSLYSAPKKEDRQIDFLSDDIIEDMATEIAKDTSLSNSESAAEKSELTFDKSPISASEAPVSQVEVMFSPSTNTATDVVAPMDCSEPALNNITPALSNTSPFKESGADSFKVHGLAEEEKNPFETIGEEDTDSFVNTGSNIFGVGSGDTVMMSNANVFGTNESNGFSGTPAHNAECTPTQGNIFGDVHSGLFSDDKTDNFNGKVEETFVNEMDSAFGIEGEEYEASQAVESADPGWGDPSEAMMQDTFPESQDAFDAFSAKFDNTSSNHINTSAWGDDGSADAAPSGFEAEAFDPFLSMGAPPPPAATPRLEHQGSRESTDDSFSVFIRPKETEPGGDEAAVPTLAPPPRPQAAPESPRVNPFDKSGFELPHVDTQMDEPERRPSGGESPPTPLFDEDVSQPLEDFPRTKYQGPGWEMHLRQPNKKKITGQRFWKKIFVRVTQVGDAPVVQLSNSATDKEPFQELPLQACYSVSEVGAQQFDQFGKIFTVKLQYVFYKERPGVRPGQVTKAERITNKLSQFAAYAIQGDYQGVKEFGSDLRKLGLPVEHAPQVSQLFKIGSLNYEDVKQFSCCVEEALFRLSAHRDRALTYKMEEVQITAVDELYVEQDAEGSVQRQIARVRIFFLGFLSGMPDVELGVNDLRRQGREVVGRHDIIPVVTEEWIRVEAPEFHACVTPQDFTDTQIIKFKPPDACYIELMRFRIRPPKNRELPLQLKAQWCVTGNKVELRADVLVPGFASRKLGQVPCEDVSIRFPIPECWIYLFRVEKHFRYGSVKSAHRRTGKIKGIERFLGTVDALQESLIEVTSGQAKYEHQHRAIVWRMPRLPKEGQGAYTTHNLVCRMALTSFDQVPAELARHAHVEFTMPATQASHVTVRSVSLQHHDGEPPEKYVRYLARHEYIVGIERTSGQSAPAYAIAAKVTESPEPAPAPLAPQPPSSDSDSD